MLLAVRDLSVRFPTPAGLVRAVDGVSFSLGPAATMGIVGESGSGKSVLNLSILGLIKSPPALVAASQVEFEGEDLRHVSAERLRHLRGNRLAMIFQDPMTSLNPFLTIGDQLAEPLLVHRGFSSTVAKKRILELLVEVGIPDPVRGFDAYPHQFSGGMRQRAMVAMALACEPALLIADEPTTALDVTIQAQILDLMKSIREKHKTSIILITHDLGVAAGFCERICVMYAGRIVEEAPTAELFANPRHPYTRALIAAAPRRDENAKARFQSIRGAPPDLARLPSGCAFAPRCDFAIDRCHCERPPLETVPLAPSRAKACFVELEGGTT